MKRGRRRRSRQRQGAGGRRHSMPRDGRGRRAVGARPLKGQTLALQRRWSGNHSSRGRGARRGRRRGRAPSRETTEATSRRTCRRGQEALGGLGSSAGSPSRLVGLSLRNGRAPSHSRNEWPDDGSGLAAAALLDAVALLRRWSRLGGRSGTQRRRARSVAGSLDLGVPSRVRPIGSFADGARHIRRREVDGARSTAQ